MPIPNDHAEPFVLVTGCSGLIGTRLIESLAAEYRVVGLDIESSPTQAKNFHWVPCDLTDDASLQQAMQTLRRDFGQRIASVVHLAAYYDFSGEPSDLYRELTVEGTRRLLHQLQAFEVELFIFSSTLLVMKPSPDGQPVNAHSPVEAEWDYPQSKLVTEELIRNERGPIPALILRLAGIYDEQGHSVPLAQQMSRIYEKQLESYVFPGDKSHGQSFIHLDDAVACIGAAIRLRGQLPPEETLVIGEEDVMSYEELQNELGLRIHGKEWTTIRIPKAIAKAGAWVQDKLASGKEDAPFIKPWMIDLADQHYPVDLGRARDLLQWKPRHTLRATLSPMVRNLLQDPRGWYTTNALPLPDHLQSASSHAS